MIALIRALYLAWKLRHIVKDFTYPTIKAAKPEIEIVGGLLKDTLKDKARERYTF